MFAVDFELTSFEPLAATARAETTARFAVVDINRDFAIFSHHTKFWFDADNLNALIHSHNLARVGEPISIGRSPEHSFWGVCVRHLPADRDPTDSDLINTDSTSQHSETCGSKTQGLENLTSKNQTTENQIQQNQSPNGRASTSHSPTNLSREAGAWQGLRALLDALDAPEFAVIARAVALARWRTEHRFCGRCGRKTGGDKIDGARTCRNCRLRFYPRIAPCMIVLVRDGDKILLAHHARAKREVYSPLAGFIEAGESAEEAVAREVFEEVGIRIKNIRYFASQSWPFPGQLMLAYYADYDAGSLNWREHEIRHADWFSLNALPTTPNDKSVAGWLIREAPNTISTPQVMP